MDLHTTEPAQLRLWQFPIVGLALGLAFGATQVLTASDFDPERRSFREPERVLQLLDSRHHPDDPPALRNIIIYPLTDDRQRAQLISFEARGGPFDVRDEWVRCKAWITIPIEHEATIDAYVKRLRKQGRLSMPVRFAWWRTPSAIVLLSSGAGVVFVGVVLPVLLTLVAPARYRELWRGQSYPNIAPPTPPITDDDPDNHGPDAQVKAEPRQARSPKGYSGEYYPVARDPPHDSA